MFRNPSSYAELHYHTKIASHFRAADGGRWFVRYRLVPADRRDDTGFVDPGGRLVPPEIIPRRAGDARSRTFLHDELRARLATAPITYLLQIQLRAVTASVAEDDAALDCTRPWAEAWRDVATLTLDARADEARVDALRFDPFNAPPDLALPLARSASERASLGHLRSIVYEMAARSRAERAPEPAPASSATAKPERGGRLRVCVVGAGASGLSAAWALEREGHHVTVLERGASVAGKCDSLEIDGRSYDWGGHVCTAQYTSLAAMVDALGVEKEPATPTQVLDLETGRVRPREDSPRLREELLRYHRARDAGFVDVVRPGLHRVAGALAQPVGAWLRAEGLRDLGATLGINYTSCGYGFLGDEELAALYFVKAVEMVGILPAAKPSRLPEMWSVRGGFGAFWCRVAAGLADVRCNVAPLAIERGDDGVVVHTEGGRLEFDRLILASPLDQTPSFLDSTAGERDLFSRIRYLDYHTFVCRAHGLPESGFYLLQQHCEDPRRAGHAVAFHHRHEGSDVYLFYAYGGPDLDRSAIEARLHEDVARLGGRLDAVLDHRPWKYFPHASSRDIEAGYYDRLEALQGQRRTYYVGSLFNFELIECNVAYAHDLVARFFGDEAPSAALPDAPGLVHAAGALPALAEMASPPARAAVLTDYLQRLFAEELRLPALPPPSSRFLELGLDSIKSVEVFQRLSMDTGGRTLAPVIFFDHPTIAELATYLAGELATSPAREPALPSSSRVERPLPTGARVSTTDAYTQIEDVVFADAHGVALTLDVFVPTCAPSGLAIVDVVSALWGSGREVIVHHKVYGTYDAFCRRGFTVFAVRPGSASRFTGEDMVAHVREAIRWVKSRAHEYGIDADRLGLLGGSAGGHLACLAALTPTTGDPAAADRRAQVDSRVHALVAHCPTTRYQPLDVGPEYVGLLRQLAFPAGRSEGYTPAEIAARFEALSPIAHVGAGAPPTLIVHARHDRLVPFDASEAFIAALQAAGNHAELEVRESDRHPWPGIEKDMISAAEWMESTLRPRPLAGGAWLRALRPVADPSLRLVCVHHAGGSAAAFDAWPAGLPEGIEILAVELPGRGAREGEPCSTRLDDVLAALDEALTPLFDRPYALFGHSFGAVIAFELCRRLRRRGAPLPIQLFASGFVGPSVYDHRTALDAVALAPVLELASPVLEADYHLFRTWSHVAEAPLDVPITALGGASDPSTPARALDAWRLETSAAFERVTFPGYHFYLLSDPAPLLEQVSRDLARAAAGDDGEARARSFAAAWRARPHALRGAWNAFDLCWLARIAGPDPREPAFPEALAALVPLQGPDGGVGAPSPHPYCNLVTALAFANTLLRWNDDGRHTPAIERALAHALTEHARAQLPLASFATGTPDRFFRFHGFFGRWLIPARECQSLLDHGGRHLTADQRRMALSYAAAKDLGFGDGPLGEADYDRLFDQDSLALHFAEYFPDHAFTSAAARAHARRAAGLPGLTAAVAARYLEITGDPRAHARISAALERPLDGLRPGGRLQELHFALAYLLRGGVELRRHFGAEIAELEASVSADGVGVEPGARLADADATAVVQHVCHALGLATKMPTRGLDRFWNAEKSSYASADGSSTYTVSTTLHVLEAYLSAPDVTRDEQLAVWQRVVTLLDARPWTELHHLSPFYVWEKIVAIVGAGEHRFPEAPTRAPRDALAQILAHQHASGGFHAALAEAPTVEETALGLLALRSALRWQRGLEARSEVEVEAAARRARSFLRRARLHPTPHPDLWVGKLLYTPVNLVEAIVTSSLAEGVTG
jgi:surfactin synthase thioesterase subunit/acetyl esterase/lipase